MAHASSNIIDFSYDSMQNILTVYFLAGGKHEFYNFSYQKYQDFLKAKSKGKFFNSEIKDKFKSQKIY